MDTLHLQVEVNNGEENQNHPPFSMPFLPVAQGPFCCHCLSAQGGLGMMSKEGGKKVVTVMKSNGSNVTQGSRDTQVIFVKPMNCPQ